MDWRMAILGYTILTFTFLMTMSPALRTEPKSQSFTREKSDLEKTSIKLKMFATYHLMAKHQTFQLFELTDKNTWKQMLIKRTWNQMLIQINLKTNDRPKMLENKSSSKNAWKQMFIAHPRKEEKVQRWRHRLKRLTSSPPTTAHNCYHYHHQYITIVIIINISIITST